MTRLILYFTFLLLLSLESFSQDKLRVYLNGINGYEIKKSQLLDTSARVIINSDKIIRGYTRVYFSGGGFQFVRSIDVSLGSHLTSMLFIVKGDKEKLVAGTIITIDDFIYKDEKTKKFITFYGSQYKVIDD